ncbi:hypothetical protein ABWL39_08755 [Chitinivorax sp. PXF-14]|uniref:hypothetical protein n=1 Tax=Chitinivorax sp. PXF-14 TaxID=3230488 RepID=UPI0034677E05
MTAFDLQTPLLDNGLRHVFFFNGRLLTAGDLKREQDARRLADMRLGTACGEGIVRGLEVTVDPDSSVGNPIVAIAPGTAVSRAGQVLVLDKPTAIAIASQARAGSLADSGFGPCSPTAQGTYIAGAGLYLLTIAPAGSKEGKVPTSGLELYGGGCNTDVLVDTVQIRRLSLDSELGDLASTDEQWLRSQVAWRCFGIEAQQGFAANAYGPVLDGWGVADRLRPDTLTPCEVPLAVIYWTADGLRFIDMWAARRRLTDRRMEGHALGVWAGERRRVEGEALWLQFQSQLDDIVAAGQLAGFSAKAHLRFLPAAGLLPVALSAPESGFDPGQFFAGLDVGSSIDMDASRLPSLLTESFEHAPIDLSNPPPLRLYRIHENRVASEAGQRPQAVLVFASCALRFAGNARFNYATWDHDHFADTRF